MKKRILGLMAIVVIAAVAAWNVYMSQSKNEMALSDVALENVEALANNEGGSTCSGNCSSWIWALGSGVACDCGRYNFGICYHWCN